MALACLVLGVPAAWVLWRHLTDAARPWASAARRSDADRDGETVPLPVVLVALFLLAPASCFFGRLAWRESRGSLAVWHGALELRYRGRSRFWPWPRARAWRRSDECDVIIAFARADDAPTESVVVVCESRAQREAIIARLIESDVATDPWLDDPRRFN